MANLLKKSFIYAPEQIEVIYNPGYPGYTTYHEEYFCASTQVGENSGDGQWIKYVDDQTGIEKIIWVPDSVSNGSGSVETKITYEYVCQTHVVAVEHSGQPASYGYVTEYKQSPNIGWNSGGQSLTVVKGDAGASFKVPPGVSGVIVGLKTGIQSEDYSGVDIDFAFYLHSGVAQVMAKGVSLTVSAAYTFDTVFAIRRQGAQVFWIRDGEVIWTDHTDTIGLIWLEASLYMAGDVVDSPSLVHLPATGEIELVLALDMLLANHTYAFLGLKLPAPAVDMVRSSENVIELRLPSLQLLLANHAYADLSMALSAPTLRLSTQAQVVPSVVLMAAVLPPLQISMSGSSSRSGEISMVLPGLSMLAANSLYRELALALPVPAIQMGGYVGANVMAFGSFEEARPSLQQRRTITMELSSFESEAGQTMEPQSGSVVLAVQETAYAVLNWVANFMWSLSSQAMPESAWVSASEDATTWACGLDGAGSTSYGNFGFNSYARIGDHCFGARDDGLFLLEGDTDAGEAIPASIGLGQLELSSKSIKLLEAIYVGMSGSKPLVMSLGIPADDGVQVVFFDYQTRGSGPSLIKRRVDAGRGLRANYFEVELFNIDGADFAIDTLEFLVADTSRRIK